jgi:nitroreductase
VNKGRSVSESDRNAWIRGLRATRSFTDVPIPERVLARILEAGRWTGSSLNSQPWTFIVVTDPASKLALAGTGRFSAHVGGAAVVVVLVAEAGRGEFDIGRAAQNMMLAADALGIGSCPATLHDQEAVRQLLGVPDNRLARHALALGYPDHDVEATVRENMRTVTGSARKPISEIVRTDRFA